MTFICEDGHERIAHDEFHCPLCAALEDSAELENGLDGALHQAEKLHEIAEECGDADTLQLIARVAELETALWKANQRISAIDWALNNSRVKGLGRQLAAIRAAFARPQVL